MREKILILDKKNMAEHPLNMMLLNAGYSVTSAGKTQLEGKLVIKSEQPDCVLIDILSNGLQNTLSWAKCLTDIGIPYLYLADHHDPDAMEAVENSDPDGFLFKPFRENDVLLSMAIARQQHRRYKQLRQKDNNSEVHISITKAKRPLSGGLAAGIKFSGNNMSPVVDYRSIFPDIIGETDEIRAVLNKVMQVATYTSTVLILGETGVGKEGLATAIHQQSPRRSKPFIKVNCAAIPYHLIESELFGHEKGSFTGATERKTGKFEQANGGSLFLDEIGEMPLALQSKLLRVLQEKELERIGGRSTIKIDVRIIVATNSNLEEAVQKGKFRNDLFFRLNVFPIAVPALRDRKRDIQLLAEHFLEKHANKLGKNVSMICPEVIKKLNAYEWPGNIRELEHLIERHILLTAEATITEVDLPDGDESSPVLPGNSRVKTIDEVERDHIIFVLGECNGRVAGTGGAAEQLQIPSTTLNSKIKRLGIKKTYDS